MFDEASVTSHLVDIAESGIIGTSGGVYSYGKEHRAGRENANSPQRPSRYVAEVRARVKGTSA